MAERLPAHYGVDPLADIQVFAPVYKGALGIDALNARLREALNPDGRPVAGGRLRLGDKLMLSGRNLHDLGLMNGTILRLLEHREDDGVLLVSADGAVIGLPEEEAPRLAPRLRVLGAQGPGHRAAGGRAGGPRGRRRVLPAPGAALHRDDPRPDRHPGRGAAGRGRPRGGDARHGAAALAARRAAHRVSRSDPADSAAMQLVAITGAARGIGAETARELSRRGHALALGDLEAPAGGPPGASAHALDVADRDSFAAFLDAAAAHHGRPVDVLVNNAGVMWVGRFDAEPASATRRMLEVNLLGVIHGMALAAPAMRARGAGHVINVASAASKIAPGGEATYCATKHAVHGYSAAVREELRGSGVEVSVVMPVVVETELAAGTSPGRAKPLVPAQVARAIADTIDRPRFEVYVPRSIALTSRLLALAPQRARDRITRAIVPDQVAETDQRARAAYEAGCSSKTVPVTCSRAGDRHRLTRSRRRWSCRRAWPPGSRSATCGVDVAQRRVVGDQAWRPRPRSAWSGRCASAVTFIREAGQGLEVRAQRSAVARRRDAAASPL